MKNNENLKRNANFDFLKIILTFMIIVLHYFNASIGGLLKEVIPNSLNYYLSHILESFCIVAVNVFVMITGYLSYKKTKIKISKPLFLFLLSAFYGILIFSGLAITGNIVLNSDTIIKALKTIFDRWFIVTFCILYLLIPYLNKLIHSLTQKQFKNLLIINALVFYLWHTFFSKTTVADSGYGIINFVNFYFVGAYIKLYCKNLSCKKSLIVYFASTTFTIAYSFVAGRAWAYTTIFNLISSISLFTFFLNLKVKENKVVGFLSSYSLSCYIIHENSLLSLILFRSIFHTHDYWNNPWMIVNLVVSVVGIFMICFVIEFLRRMLMKKIFDERIQKIGYEITCE